ncbi:uncharacterized protein [Misgurnus anguillicaudatus]|uniref:uncharacterized protein n=1 Tax=Misgurnus anguillicaudatus TaxID=75329 RepID=UPI003CCF5CED
MKALMLLLWIFVVPTHTIVLQPSLNASILYNVSAESDLFGELRPDWSAFNNEEELRNEEEVTVQEAVRQIDIPASKPFQYSPTESAISQPPFPSGTTTERTSIITSTTPLPKTTTATTKHHILNLTAEVIETRLLSNESITSDDLKVKLHAMNNSKLHLLEEVSVDTTAAAVRAGPTAAAPPGTLMAKLKNKASRANPKSNATVKKKTKKLPKRDRAKEKTTNALKKAKKARKEMKLKPTASYFPYFKDHYCPPYCSCYGRYASNSRLHIYIYAFWRIVPTDLPPSLEELRLDGNQVSAMSEAAMARCPNLLILSLSNNSLGNETSKIPPGVLLAMGNLRTLTLSHNLLTSIPLQLPLNLRELYLRGNRIHRLHGDVFWGEAELQVLDLSANRLTDKGFGKAALLNATRLESLNLEGNLLKQIPRHLPRTIKTLNLEGNLISSIGKDAFISMPQLEHLGLARNKITKVAVGAFRVLPLLHQLDVSHNGLRQVPRQLPLWLHSATFTHNKIRTVPRDAFCWGQGDGSALSRLVRVQLEHNMIDLGHLDMLAFRCLRGFQVVQFY